MPVAHLIVIALFIAASTACIITSNVIFYRIVNEVNSKRPPERQFSIIFARVQFLKITREHAQLFPESQKRRLMYVWAGIGFVLLLTVVFSGRVQN